MPAQGIGGVFLYADDVDAMKRWYAELLEWPELVTSKWGVELPSADRVPGPRTASTTFAIFAADSAVPRGQRSARLNFRVPDLDALVARLEERGLAVRRSSDEDYGRFAWLRDPEGNRVELWEPPIAG